MCMICETARRARQQQEAERLLREAQRAASALCDSLRRLPSPQDQNRRKAA